MLLIIFLQKKDISMFKFIRLYKRLFNNIKSNTPALFFMGLSIFGIITLLSSFLTSFLEFPFILVATIASFFAVWYLNILGSLTEQVDKLEDTVLNLKNSNDTLHNELLELNSLRKNLEKYAQENKSDFLKVLKDINSSFDRLEKITKDNERVLIARIAQDLEFLDSKEGMSAEEYERFINRLPYNLKNKFDELGYSSFDKVAGDNNLVDYKAIKKIINNSLS